MTGKKKVLIVGAGLAGLASALRLAKKGFEVEIVEKNAQPGGRLNQLKKDGFTFDTGPSFFSMSYEFEEFARDCDISLPFTYVGLNPLYSVNFSNSPRIFHLYTNTKELAGQFNDIEPFFEKEFEKYLKKTGKLFHDTVDLVIKRNFSNIFHYILTLAKVNPVHLPLLFRSFQKEIDRIFTSQEARSVMSLVAFFLGRTPLDTMGIYTLLSYTEFRHNGYFNVNGGMYKIVEGIVNELKKENVKFTFNTEIKDYFQENDNLKYLTDTAGNKYFADVFLINADAVYFRSMVFKQKKYAEPKLSKMLWTTGYLTFYIGLKCKLPQVNHHNYFLGDDFKSYASEVISNPSVLSNPYFYVNVVSKYNPGCAPDGCEALFFVVPVPNLIYKPCWDDKETIVNNIIADFSKRINYNIAPEIISQTIYSPDDWQNQYNLYKGSGLGLAHNFMQIGALRPQNFDEKYKNVFYTGASTIPGAGLPMAIISSKLAVERISKYAR